MHDMFHIRRDTPRKSLQDDGVDLEGHIELTGSPSLNQGVLDLNHYRIVNDVWHFFSVDWGHNCKLLCALCLHFADKCS